MVEQPRHKNLHSPLMESHLSESRATMIALNNYLNRQGPSRRQSLTCTLPLALKNSTSLVQQPLVVLPMRLSRALMIPFLWTSWPAPLQDDLTPDVHAPNQY